MQPPLQHSWINLVEIQAQIIKKLGLQRSKLYLDYLNHFLSLKLTKSEFDKLCLKTLGKVNLRLHNLLIRSVLKNASRTVGNKKSLEGPQRRNGSVPVVTQVTSPLTLTNGDILPPSPRKPRTGPRDRRSLDRKSALDPNGKTNFTPFSSSIPQSGDFHTKQTENVDFVGVNRVENTESLRRKDEKGVSLGVPFWPVNIGGPHRALHTNGLLETTTLKEHMEEITTPHGLQRVSMDCANVMNNGLDAYLKGLIRSCTELNGARSVHEPPKSGSETELRPKRLVTLLDFRVAMKLNCKQLGEDWSVFLEKICTHDFEE